MADWKPGKDHPWRRYKNKVDDELKEEKKNEKKIKPVKIFIQELSEGWEKVEVYATVSGREGKYTLSELPQTKQAAWLAGVLKRNYKR